MRQEEDLTDDQRRIIAAVDEDFNRIVWADVGTGKTVSALTVVLRRILGFESRRVLVVGPRLVAERVWSREVTEWAHLAGLRVQRIVGSPAERLEAMRADADIYTITRDNIVWLEEQFIRITGVNSDGDPLRAQYRKWRWDTVIIDECQSFKHQDSKRFRSMRRLRRLFDHVLMLTGSLRPNGYGDLWAQYYLLDGGKRLGTTEKAFRKRWFDKNVQDGVVTYDVKSEAAKAHIDRLIADVTLVMRDTQKPAPVNTVEIELDPEELRLYRKMAREACVEVQGKQITAVNAGVLWGKLLQMANGAVYSAADEDGNKEWHLIHDKKIEALAELLESLPRPVIVGYGFRHDLERMMRKLRECGVEDVGILRSNKSLDLWREGKIGVGIMHPQSAGHGLNDLYVSGAENLVWFGFTPNREFYEQLNGRLTGGHRRTGRTVTIHHLVVKKTVDEDAVAMLDFKGEDQVRTQIRVAKRLTEGPSDVDEPRKDSLGRKQEPTRTRAPVCRQSDWEAAHAA